MLINPGASAGILDDIDFICSTDSTSYPTADKIRNANRHAYKAVTDVMKVSKRWIYNDTNNTGLPYVDVTMTADQQYVTLPAALKIYAVEIKGSDNLYTKLKYFNLMQLDRTISSSSTTSGKPTRYSLTGNNVWFDVPVSSSQVTVTSGLRLWITPEIDIFLTTDTNQEPGIDEPFHRIISIGASLDYIAVNGTDQQYQKWLNQYEQLRAELRSSYANKNLDAPGGLTPIHDQLNYL